ncbi:HU family DNA-binding protein [Falsirhodobacter sp. alg1]|uniref:HU family DNA-binding protein n=1 Tax=Falsirhodobacter sp. alg1 TaxID=1472418 RepID=UPI000693B575|nr:HU family DNA-binding protein [Falsirhodobacter sp. alg1]
MATRTTSKTTKAAAAEKPAAAVETALPETSVAGGEAPLVVKMPELLDAVVEQTGEKRSTVKPILEAFLKLMGEKLGDGQDMMLPPLGKIRVVKQKDDNGPITLKLRPHTGGNKDANSGNDSLADDED